MPLRLARNVRSLHRLRMIAQVLTRHGFGHLVEVLDLGRFVPVWIRPKAAHHESLTIGQRLTRVATELGPTYVKLGQMLSTRPDLLPPEILAELKVLQDHVEPFPSLEAQNIITQELGRPLDELFQSFEADPFASGSIAQVHRAVTREGQAVVVKVRRPGIAAVIRDDMHILRALAEAIEMYVPELKAYHPTQIIEEFRRTITLELDFINEASATARFHQDFAGEPQVRSPRVHWELTAETVLTLEQIQGTPLHAVIDGRLAGFDHKALAQRIAGMFVRQYFQTGLFHADPHPGNMLIAAPATVGLIDFGMVGQVSEDTMTQFLVGLLGAVNRQIDWVVDVLGELGDIGPAADMDRLAMDLQTLLDKYYGLPLKRLDLPTIVAEVTDVVRRNDITLPAQSVMLLKSLAMAAGTVLQLDPELNLAELIQPRLKHLMLQRFSPRQVARKAAIALWHVANIVKNAPAQMRSAIRHLNRGQWQIKIQHQNLDRLARELDRSSNRLAFALIIASTIIGSSFILASDATDTVLGLSIRTYGIVGYVVAGIMGAGLVWAILRSGRLY